MEPTTSQSHTLRNILLVLVGIIVVLGVTYRFWVLPASTSALLFSLRNNADVRITPTHVPTPIDPVLSVENHVFQNISFSTPWNNGSSTQSGSTITVRYPDKKSIFLSRSLDMYTAVVGTSTEVRALLYPITDTYSLYTAMSDVTPADIHYFASNKDLAVKDMLLMLKATLFAPDGKPVYTFTTSNGMHVFAFTRSATTTATTFTTFFTPNDEEYDLFISGASQAETNSIIESLRLK